MLIPDNRDEFRCYDKAEPFFGPAPTALLEGLAQEPDIELHVISCAREPLAAPTQLARNIFFHLLHVRHGESLRSLYLASVLAIRKKLRAIRPALVHGQGTERYCALAAAMSSFPNLVTLHGIMRGMARITDARPGSFYWCNAHLESFVLKRTGGVLCNSAYTEAMVRNVARKRWRVPNALRSLFFSRNQMRERNSIPILLNIGTVEPHKRQVELFEMCERLFTNGYRFEIQFIGTVLSENAYGLEFKARIADARGFARYLEPKSDEELLGHFDQADALIHFSREESFGLVVAEALARNQKLFSTRVGGIPDIASGVELAELFDPDDLSELAASVGRWIEQDFPKPTTAALEMQKRYHPKVIAARHMEIYRELLAAETRRRV